MHPNVPDNLHNDAGDELLSSLQSALRPEPLPASLTERIRANWDRRGESRRTIKFPRPVWLGLAAAAAVTIAFVIPPMTSESPTRAVASVELTEEEASAIVQALAVMDWDGTVEYSLDLVDASLDDLQGAFYADPDTDGTNSWLSSDAWDSPPS